MVENEKKENIDFAIKLAENKIAKEDDRFNNLNSKINFYFIFLTIAISCLVFLFNILNEKIDIQIPNINPLQLLLMIKFILILLIYSLFAFLIWFIFKTLSYILSALKPINIMRPDNEAIDISIKNNSFEAKEVYLKDLLRSEKYSRGNINDKFTLLNHINYNFKRFIYLFFIIIVLFFLLFISDNLTKINKTSSNTSLHIQIEGEAR